MKKNVLSLSIAAMFTSPQDRAHEVWVNLPLEPRTPLDDGSLQRLQHDLEKANAGLRASRKASHEQQKQ